MLRREKTEPNLEPFVAHLPVKCPKCPGKGKLALNSLVGAAPPSQSGGAHPKLGRPRQGQEKPELVSSKTGAGVRGEEQF